MSLIGFLPWWMRGLQLFGDRFFGVQRSKRLAGFMAGKKASQRKTARKLMVGRVSAERSRIMAAVRCRDTAPERQMRKHLSALGLRYRLCKAGLPGRPDIVFAGAKVVVFCDGDFWHGRHWKRRKLAGQFKTRKKYWIDKIETNIARDRRNNRDLRKMGWLVLRYWESEIRVSGEMCAREVFGFVRRRQEYVLT